MAELVLGYVGIITGYIGIGLTLLGVGWGIGWQGRALANPERSSQIGRKLERWAWLWFITSFFFLGCAVAVFIALLIRLTT